jgi:hypothetical protein
VDSGVLCFEQAHILNDVRSVAAMSTAWLIAFERPQKMVDELMHYLIQKPRIYVDPHDFMDKLHVVPT